MQLVHAAFVFEIVRFKAFGGGDGEVCTRQHDAGGEGAASDFAAAETVAEALLRED